MKKPHELGPKDKTLKPSKWGHDFHHTTPQRHVPTLKGSMLAPASADDISPLTATALESVGKAFDLLAQLVGDRDHNLFINNADRDGSATREAQAIDRIKRGVLAILRDEKAPPTVGDVISEGFGLYRITKALGGSRFAAKSTMGIDVEIDFTNSHYRDPAHAWRVVERHG